MYLEVLLMEKDVVCNLFPEVIHGYLKNVNRVVAYLLVYMCKYFGQYMIRVFCCVLYTRANIYIAVYQDISISRKTKSTAFYSYLLLFIIVYWLSMGQTFLLVYLSLHTKIVIFNSLICYAILSVKIIYTFCTIYI